MCISRGPSPSQVGIYMVGHLHSASLCPPGSLPISRLLAFKRGRGPTHVLVIEELRRRSFVSCTVAFTLDRSTDVLTTLRLKPRTSSNVLAALWLAAAASSLAFLPFSLTPKIKTRTVRRPAGTRVKLQASFYTETHSNHRFSC